MPATYEVIVTADGRVTLPQEILGHLRGEAGDTIRFDVDDPCDVRVRVKPTRLAHVIGSLVAKGPTTVDLDEEIEEAMAIALLDEHRPNEAVPDPLPEPSDGT